MTNFLNSIFVSLFLLAIFGLICITLQKSFPSIASQKTYRQAFFTDLSFWLLLTLTGLLFTGPSLEHFIKPQEYAGLFSAQLKNMNLYIKFLLCIIAVDFAAYWVHRAFHSKYLWKFHAIHHSPLEIDWLSSSRFHPVEIIAQVFVMFLFATALGFNFSAVMAAVVIRSWYGYIVHSNLSWHYGKIGRYIASPFFHRWHHTTQKEGLNKNFAGAFSVWDYIFKTAYNPQGKQPSNFGIGRKIGDNLWDYIKYPFIRSR